MDTRISYATDTATLVLMDRGQLAPRKEPDWWTAGGLHEIPEVAEGRIAAFALGGDGVHTVRVTTGELTKVEHDHANAMATGLRVVVPPSGRLVVGAGEALSPDYVEDEAAGGVPGTRTIEVPPGEYAVTAYHVDIFYNREWIRPDGTMAEGAPPDLVVVLELLARKKKHKPPKKEPSLAGGKFVFDVPDRPARQGPVYPPPRLGEVITWDVGWKDGKPEMKRWGYALEPASWAGLAWKDNVRMRVLSVDGEAKRASVEVLSKTSALDDLKSPDEDDRVRAIEILQYHPDASAEHLELLVRMIGDRASSVRIAALEAVLEMKRPIPGALAAAEARLQDRVPRVCELAQKVIARYRA